ncbi:hypothetical protein VTP01DRAFT_9416 [Rhizomucor pusillus]|uniref:uncharacterized protein n=1 Tax=Rhizomucor pusillus TaxID=4840 RepID=UPI0037436161
MVAALWIWIAALSGLCVHAQSLSELGASDFSEATAKGTWFVEFFSPHCPHCIHFAPTWQKLADDYASLATSRDFHFAKVDCTLNGDLCKENNVQYFPFLQLYHQGSAIEIYPPRERNWDKLVEYITTQSEKYAPSTTQVSVPNPAGLSIDMDGPALANAQKSGQPLFIKYYAPWCPHCQHMAPAWERMASDLARQINVGEVNCDDHRDVCIENGVTSFPTLVLYAHGNAYEYHDDRSLVSLVGFAKKKAGPMIRQADSTQLENVLKEDPVAFVYIHKDGTDSAMDLLQDVAKKFLDGIIFYTTDDYHALRLFNLAPTDLPTALISKDGKHIKYPSHSFANTEQTQSSLTAWIQKEKFPLVSEVGPGNAEEILRGEHMVVLAVINKEDESSYEKFKAMAEDHSRHQKASSSLGHVLFARLEGRAWGDYARRAYSIPPNVRPAVIIVDPINSRLFNHNAQGAMFAVDNPEMLRSALRDIADNKLTGISTLPFPSRVGQKLQHGFNILRTHWLLSGIGFFAVAYIFFRRMSRHHRSHILPTVEEHKD